MNENSPKAFGAITAFFGDGPWRSKSVLAALAAIVVGVGSWFADLKKNRPPGDASEASPHSSAATAPAPTNDSPDGPPGSERKSLPPYVPFCASYAAAYCIGWLFRKLLRLILVTSAVVAALLMYGKFVGWDLAHAQEQVRRGSKWAQHEAATQRDYLLHLLPSAVGGSAGLFLGFRRRNRTTVPAR